VGDVAAVRRAAAPAGCSAGVARGLLADLLRSKHELLVENAMLRQQLIVAARKLKRPRSRPRKRALLSSRELAMSFTVAVLLAHRAARRRWQRCRPHRGRARGRVLKRPAGARSRRSASSLSTYASPGAYSRTKPAEEVSGELGVVCRPSTSNQRR
jgi:hypothetical protein